MGNIIRIKQMVLLTGDALVLFVSLPLTLFLREDFNLELFRDHTYPFIAIYLFILVVFYIIGLYDIRSFRSATSTFPIILAAHSAGLVLGAMLFYTLASPTVTPKTNLALNMLIAAIVVWLWRIIFQRYLAGHLKIRVAIAGFNAHARELAEIIKAKPYMGYRLEALISTEPTLSNNVSYYTKVFFADKNLIENLKEAKIDTVITAENPHLNPAIAQAFYECIPYKIRFLDLAQSYALLTGRIPISYINQTWFLENINEQQKILYGKIKRIADILSAGLIFFASLPLWPVIALAIKWESSGTVFYTQKRVGENKKLFSLIKFRSMIHNAELGKPVWAQAKDPRVTRVGSFLRRTHLDEMPQMINVIRGDLSLVGPRPERTEFVKELETQIPHYNIRHIIKPGFTGWAQVNFRYARTPIDTYEKFQYDLYYLKNRSLSLDAAILLKTVNLFFKKEHSY